MSSNAAQMWAEAGYRSTLYRNGIDVVKRQRKKWMFNAANMKYTKLLR